MQITDATSPPNHSHVMQYDHNNTIVTEEPTGKQKLKLPPLPIMRQKQQIAHHLLNMLRILQMLMI